MKDDNDISSSLLLNYVIFSSVYLFSIALNLALVMAFCSHPLELGLYFFLPYFTWTKLVTRHETKEGARVNWFSEDFLLFAQMRKHLRLSFHRPSLPKALSSCQKDDQFIFAFFPHGTSCDYRILMDGMLKDIIPTIYHKTRTLAASVLFLIPVVREMALYTGCINASRDVAERILDKGYSIVVLPGGEAEQLRTVYQQERIYLKNRKGFIKLGLRKNIPIVPVYVFGVNDYYYTTDAGAGVRKWLQKKFGVCIPLIAGLWGSIFCPFPIPTTIVFGEPISFPKIVSGTSPTTEELNTAHDEFCKALRQLFDTHKQELGYGDRVLEIL